MNATSNRVLLFPLLAVPLVLIATTSGCSEAPVVAPPTTVDVVVAEPITKQVVEWDEYTGRLEPIEFVEVRARVGGFLKEIDFVEGQIVHKGDLLCVIDQRPFASAVRRAEATVSQARAKLGESESQLAQSLAAKKDVEAQLTLEQQRYKRAQRVVERGAISKEEFDIRGSSLEQAKAQLESADANIATARSTIEVAAAAVDAAEAELHTANIQLNYTEVKSPINGRVSLRAVTEGNLISGGTAESTLLTTIVSLDPIHVMFDADEAAFLKYQRLASHGTRVSDREAKNPVFLALADEYPNFPHEGHMDFVDNRLDPNTGTMRGRAILRNPDFLLTPGLFARIRVPGSGAHKAVLVSDAAVISDQSEKFVYVVEKDGTIRRQQVKIGGSIHGLRIVSDGLNGEEKIVIRGLQRIRPGLKAKTSLEELVVKNDEGLPDTYRPVPEEEWISRNVSYLPNERTDAPARTARSENVRTTASAP